MGALGYEHAKCCQGGGIYSCGLLLLDIPARTGQALGHIKRELQVTLQGTPWISQMQAPHSTSAPGCTYSLAWAHTPPQRIRRPGLRYQDWCEAVNSLDSLWYMTWEGRRLYRPGFKDYWTFLFQLPVSLLWQRGRPGFKMGLGGEATYARKGGRVSLTQTVQFEYQPETTHLKT